jgi:hypothetical protein
MKSQTTTLKTLFETKKNIENLKKFLIDTEIVTRKWILEDTKENEEEWVKNLKARRSDDEIITLILKRFDQSNQFERTSKRENQRKHMKLFVLLNSVIIFRLHTLND